MSQQSRPTQGGVPAFMTSSMMPNVRGNASFMYTQTPRMPYAIATVPAAQQFVPTTIVYPNQLAVDSPGGSVVPPGMQRFYVPVQQMPVHAYTTIPLGQRTPADPAVLLEEQRKLEKERNFQMQQQRLKQFTIAGKKGSLNADNLLDSMFGKPDLKKQTSKSQSDKSTVFKESSRNNCPVSKSTEHQTPTVPISVSVVRQDVGPGKSNETKTKEKVQKDPKELENLMLKCSNFSGPQKAKLFQKPAVKELPKSSPRGTTFSASEKAIDWCNIQGLDNVFTSPKPRFPTWCKRESVPPLFLQIQNIVTENDSHPPETSILYPILISSGLPQTVLGEIWEMVNRTSPGTLSSEEMYAALALVAVAQAGHPVKSVDILHQIPACPTPNLQCFNAVNQVPEVAPAAVPNHATTAVPNEKQPRSVVNHVVANVRPTSISASADNISNNISQWTPFANNDEKVEDDDEFDDFKSHTPMAVNAPPLVESTADVEEDDFDDFKQAPCPAVSFASFPKMEEKSASTSVSHENLAATSDLMLPEDKYSVFRLLQQDVGEGTKAKPARSSGLFTDSTQEPLLIGEEVTSSEQSSPYHISASTDNADDDFGDFLDAGATPVPSPVMSRSKPEQNQQVVFAQDFADFSQLNSDSTFSEPDVTKAVQLLSKPNNSDDDFGEFAAFQKSMLKPDGGLDCFSSSSKDNISLAESQSISSLEFGTFEVIGRGIDSKTSLSRQGSIPSLDLKVPGVENVETEDEFGDMQSAGSGPTVSPSPSVDTNKSCEEKPLTSVSRLPMQPSLSVPLADKYSVIRSEQVFNEDQHISEWTKCVQSSLDILKNATHIFNQMSCSSVCNEVLGTEEGKNYVKNVIEVYKVVCRIALASKSYEKLNNKLSHLIKDSEQAFNTLTVFLSGSPLLPDEPSLDFSSGVLRADSENNEKACGVCLLNVDSRSKSYNNKEDLAKLTYGRRQYHCPCANLWVNCVDPLLPVLTLPQLI